MNSLQFAILFTAICVVTAAPSFDVWAGPQSNTVCVHCATHVCPRSCGQNTCVTRWARCQSRGKRCCGGWRCVWSRNQKVTRCEPPRPRCAAKWTRCQSRGQRCCSGWRCVWSSSLKRTRCEPPRRPRCAANWKDCRSTRCCNRWRCVRRRYRRGGTWHRCEPTRWYLARFLSPKTASA